MARKKVKKRRVNNESRRSAHLKLRNAEAWFRKRDDKPKDKWGFIPINWKGWTALVLLIGLNVFAGNYFKLNELVLDNYLKMGVVFFLSIFIFIEIAKYKTKRGKR